MQLRPSRPGRQGERGGALRERRAGLRKGRLSEAAPERTIRDKGFLSSFNLPNSILHILNLDNLEH